MTPAAPRSSRLFRLLHSAGWSGVFLLSYLSGLALDQPVSYWKISLPLAAAGFLVTLGLRHILRRPVACADDQPIVGVERFGFANVYQKRCCGGAETRI